MWFKRLVRILPSLPGNPEATFRMVWLNSKLIILSAVTNLGDRGVGVGASPKALHCGFKQILYFLLGTGLTQF